MQKFNVGIIGNGFVGNALYTGLREFADIKIYDSNNSKCLNSLAEVFNNEFIFICVPTPSKQNGEIDLSNIVWCFEEAFSGKYVLRKNTIFVIKSTVSPGTCKKLSKKHNTFVVSNPEFLTERFALQDFNNPRSIIIGGEVNATERVKELYKLKFLDDSKYFLTDSTTSELIKYTTNCFFSVKISFMNEIKQIADSVEANWKDVVKGFVSDGRVFPQHLDVPGHDGELGFGGKCLPKDLSALICLARSHNIIPSVMTAAQSKNRELRKNERS
jgi:UDPglucose 6-dehydrogenase